MREIKFRAWNLTENRFLTTEELIYRIEVEAKRQLRLDNNLISLGGKPDPSDEIIFQQYTGLKDKNGVEVYEGDIVEYRRERGLVDFNDRNYGEVLGWNLLLYQYVPLQKERWFYQEKEQDGQLPAIEFYYGCPPDKSWEVVGNIFEGVAK